MNKEEFINNVKEGCWFRDGKEHLVKVKSKQGQVIFLWLSKRDPESMCFKEVHPKNFEIKEDGTIEIWSSGVYHFGEARMSVAQADDIYDDCGNLLVDKMKDVILNAIDNIHYKLVTADELNQVWEQLEKRQLSDYPELNIR